MPLQIIYGCVGRGDSLGIGVADTDSLGARRTFESNFE